MGSRYSCEHLWRFANGTLSRVSDAEATLVQSGRRRSEPGSRDGNLARILGGLLPHLTRIPSSKGIHAVNSLSVNSIPASAPAIESLNQKKVELADAAAMLLPGLQPRKAAADTPGLPPRAPHLTPPAQ
jgi:hypothetical protein